MSELISVLIVIVAQAALFFFAPNTAVSFIAKTLSYVVKNDKMRNKVENRLGVIISKLGVALITNIHDFDIEQEVATIEEELAKLEEKFKKEV